MRAADAWGINTTPTLRNIFNLIKEYENTFDGVYVVSVVPTTSETSDTH